MPRSDRLDERFQLSRQGNGCALFYKELYIAQLNWVNSGLNTSEAVSDINKTWNLDKKILMYTDKHDIEDQLSGQFESFRFSSSDGLLFISFFDNHVVSFYYHPEIHNKIFEDIEGEKISATTDKKIADQTERDANTKKQKNKL